MPYFGLVVQYIVSNLCLQGVVCLIIWYVWNNSSPRPEWDLPFMAAIGLLGLVYLVGSTKILLDTDKLAQKIAAERAERSD